VEQCDCIIPAAGNSTRMGRWKPVLPFEGGTIIQTVVATALRACARVVLVAGYRGAELAALFSREPRVLTVINERWSDGMFSSLRRGVEAARTDRFFVTLGDMPWITTAVYEALLRCTDAEVIFPLHDGRRGHPVLFDACVKEAVSLADALSGSMRLIAGSFRVRDLDWPDDSVVRDIDTEGDLPVPGR